MLQLASKYKVSERTIRRDLESMRFVRKKAKYKEVIVQLDTTYWGRRFGLMVIKDALRNKVLWHKYVYNETIGQYMGQPRQEELLGLFKNLTDEQVEKLLFNLSPIRRKNSGK